MTDALHFAEAKAKFSEMIARVDHTHDRITVTRNGRPAAVVVSPDGASSLRSSSFAVGA